MVSRASWNSIGAAGWEGLHSLPRPAATVRVATTPRLFGRVDHEVAVVILPVRSRSTCFASQVNDQDSVSRNVASSTFLPVSWPGENW